MTTPDPLKDMHPVKRTITHNAMNVAQPGDMLPTSAVENLGLNVGDDDDADVGPAGAPPVVPETPQVEVRYDKPMIPTDAGPLGTTAGQPSTGPATVDPVKDAESERPAKGRRTKAQTDEESSEV
jgi:hypothetical protein